MARQLVFFDAIDVIGRLRAPDPDNVRRLAASIKEIGLQTPISVMEPETDGDAYTLVAGLHRLEAMKSLGTESAECEVLAYDPDAAALWEIDENLARAELSDAERAAHHARRKEIVERRGLVSKRGDNQHTRASDKLSKPSYAKDAADKLGVDERTVRRDVRRGEKIAPEVLSAVAGTELDKGVVLDRLASTPRENQRAVLAEIKEHQDAAKLTRTIDKAVARSNAEVAAEMVCANLDAGQIEALAARLANVTMRDFIAALAILTTGARAA